MWDWFCAAAAGASNVAVGFSFKGAQSAGCRTAHFGLAGSGCALIPLLAALVSLPGPRWEVGSWGIGTALGSLFALAVALNVSANRLGPPSVAWSVANMGLLVPVGLAWCCGETPMWSDGAMLAAFVLMVLAFYRGVAGAGDAIGTKTWCYALLLAAVFLVNGLLMFCFKLNQLWFPRTNPAGLLVAAYAASALWFAAAALRRRGDGGSRSLRGREIGWGALLGFSIGLTQLLMQAAMGLPAVIVFPLVQGVALMGGVLLIACVYRERLNRFKIVGLLLGLAVIVLSVVR